MGTHWDVRHIVKRKEAKADRTQRVISNYTISIAVELGSTPARNTVVAPGTERCLHRGLSRVDRKTHARF